MKLSKSALIATLLIGSLSSGQAFAAIYKITQEDGSVVYSDKPSGDAGSQVEVINTPANPIQTYPARPVSNPVSNNQYSSSTPSSNKDVNVQALYQTMLSDIDNSSQQDAIHYNLQIETPTNESAFRKPAQTIDVSINVSPALSQNDQIVIAIDGKDVATGAVVSIPTIDLMPGEHTLTARVMSKNGTSQVQSIKFYIIQNTVALQRKIKLVNQLNAYYQLPWYKRVMLQLKRKKPSVRTVEKESNDATAAVSTAFR